MEVEVNYLAVVLAAASTMVVGSVWYTPKVFGNAWGALAKVDMNKKMTGAQMTWLMGSAFVASLLGAYVLAHVAYLSDVFFDNTFLEASLSTGFWLWLGFAAARLYVHDAFEGRRKKLTGLNVAHEFVAIMVMALVIGVMGV